MKAEKIMIHIVRLAAGIAFFLAAGGILDIGIFLWRQRQDFSNLGVGGLGNSCVLVGVLLVTGTLLWRNSKRLGPWLCSEPARKRRVPHAEAIRRSRDENG